VATNEDASVGFAGQYGNDLHDGLVFGHAAALLDVVLHDLDLKAGDLAELAGNPLCRLRQFGRTGVSGWIMG